MAPPLVVAGPLAAPSLKLLLHPALPGRGLGDTPIRLMRTVKGLTANRIPPAGATLSIYQDATGLWSPTKCVGIHAP